MLDPVLGSVGAGPGVGAMVIVGMLLGASAGGVAEALTTGLYRAGAVTVPSAVMPTIRTPWVRPVKVGSGVKTISPVAGSIWYRPSPATVTVVTREPSGASRE